jgi:hypothetical protein
MLFLEIGRLQVFSRNIENRPKIGKTDSPILAIMIISVATKLLGRVGIGMTTSGAISCIMLAFGMSG